MACVTGADASDAPTIVQIVPSAPGGVRDFAEGLKGEWERHGVASQLIAWSRAESKASPLHRRLTSLRQSETGPLLVVLHFSGYGYDARALCFWLLADLRLARRELGPTLRVATVVHELYASGSPWQSAFWIGGVQAHVTRSIARLSDGVWTNSSHHGFWLQKTLGSVAPVRVRAVFSNVGEPDDIRAFVERGPGLVVFGSEPTRRRALAKLPTCASELRALGVAGVTEVGDGPSCTNASMDLPHSYLGRLDSDALRGVLQSHRFALIDYPSLLLGKSGVFAAYASHGCLVLNTAGVGADAEGLQRGRHYLALGRGEVGAVDVPHQAMIAGAVATWYRGHPVSKQAAELLEWLATLSPGEPVDRESRVEASCALPRASACCGRE